jgi:hypothetical protein
VSIHGGEVALHTESVDPDELSYFELEAICRPYGYKSGDLIFFLHPGQSLANGLHLITSDHNVLFMVEQHKTHNIVQLYIVSFEEGIVDVFEGDDEDEDGARVDLNDPWWHDKISDEEDLFDVDVDDDTHGAGPSTVVPDRSECQGGEQDRNERGEGEGNEANDGGEGNEANDGGEGNEASDEGEGNEDNDGGEAAVDEGAGGNSSFDLKRPVNDDDGDDDDDNSEMGRSDILESPVPSDDDCETPSARTVDFTHLDLQDPSITIGMKFPNIEMFREAIRVYNVKKGKDIKFKRSERNRCVCVCRDARCKYRVYGRKMRDEESFQVRSMQARHICGRKYRNTIVNSTWIAQKLFDKFRVQPNMPLDAIQHEVNDKWHVDVNPSMMYRARRKARVKLYGKLENQYERLWDYCETLRCTNNGSCVVMKVDRPNPNLPPKFGRMYVSLAAMKKGFLEGCRPIIGVDGCFLKGPYKGQLLSAVGRDGNNNMYPIAFAIVEAEVKDSWIWFLETLVSDLGTHVRHARPTFMSDRQKVTFSVFVFPTLYIFIELYFDLVGNIISLPLFFFRFCRVLCQLLMLLCQWLIIGYVSGIYMPTLETLVGIEGWHSRKSCGLQRLHTQSMNSLSIWRS